MPIADCGLKSAIRNPQSEIGAFAMVIVMQRGATEQQLQKVIDRLTGEGFDVHRSTGVERTVLGVVGGKTSCWTESRK